MAFTRFHDDPYRIQKQIDQSSFVGRYQLDRPGCGTDLPFLEDPQMRLEHWGANMHHNAIHLENDLRGLTRPLNRDTIHYKSTAVHTSPYKYNDAKPFIEESRASHPAWMYKDLEQTRWETPFLNPLANCEIGFQTNVNTRILEKDYFKPMTPVIQGMENADYYLTGRSVCIMGTESTCPGTLYQNRIQ